LSIGFQVRAAYFISFIFDFLKKWFLKKLQIIFFL
jgi:hypothetical protein